MAITFFDTDTPDFASETDATSYLTPSWTPPTSGLIFAFVWARRTGGSATPTMSGNNITWVEIGTNNDASTSRRLSLFAANASGSSTGQTTIDFAGVTQARCIACFSYATGVDLSGGVAAAFVQTVIDPYQSGGTGTATLASPASSDNRPLVGWNVENGLTATHRTNWTELDDLLLTAQDIVEVQCREDAFETTASITYTPTGDGCRGIAVEIKAAASGSTYTKAGIAIHGP